MICYRCTFAYCVDLTLTLTEVGRYLTSKQVCERCYFLLAFCLASGVKNDSFSVDGLRLIMVRFSLKWLIEKISKEFPFGATCGGYKQYAVHDCVEASAWSLRCVDVEP